MSVLVRNAASARLQDSEFARDVIAGLTAERKTLPAKYLYDDHGSALFEAITALPEYYPTRTELGILEERAGEIARLVPPGAALIELGSGWGGFAYQFKKVCPDVTYVCVDLPPTMLFSGVYLTTLFPEAKVLFYGEPGFDEKCPSNLLATPSHSLASAGGSFLAVIFGHDLAYSALTVSHFSTPGSVSGLIASTGHSGSQTPQSMHSSGWMTSMFSPS